MTSLPLFPLSAVLMPFGRMRLQVFEQRYLTLIKDVLRNDSGFGVVWIRAGREVATSAEGLAPQLADIGVMARIVDWDSLPNGLLGLTIEGRETFRLLSRQRQADHLNVGDIEWLPAQPPAPLPAGSESLQELLERLREHPMMAALGMAADINEAGALGCVLTQLLPIAESQKYELLCVEDPVARLTRLSLLLDAMAQ